MPSTRIADVVGYGAERIQAATLTAATPKIVGQTYSLKSD